MKETETITIHDSHDFHYEVELQHQPYHGFSTAYYKGGIIAQSDAYKLYKPISDDDREWEEYEERFAEWRDQVIDDLKRICKKYFDNYAKN